jgi:hypothetical protein
MERRYFRLGALAGAGLVSVLWCIGEALAQWI